MVAYIAYLQYWKQAEYARFIKYALIMRACAYSHDCRRYPHCLFFLEMLQRAAFREELAKPGFQQFIAEQQV